MAREAARQVDADHLVAAARRRREVGEHRPLGCHEVGLLGELALRGRERVLAVDVEQPGGDLPVARAHRVPVLLDQQHPVVVVEREHADGAGVVHVLAHDARAPP